MLEELRHVIHAFELSLGHNGTSESDGRQRGGFVVCQALVCHLNVDMVVIDGFVVLLGEVGNIGAGCLGRVLRLICFEELPLDDVPVIQVAVIFLEGILNLRILLLTAHPAVVAASLTLSLRRRAAIISLSL